MTSLLTSDNNTVMKWSKGQGDVWSGIAGPFALRVQPKGDGRFTWQIVESPAKNPSASGVASSLGAAKTACEQYVKRSGRV